MDLTVLIAVVVAGLIVWEGTHVTRARWRAARQRVRRDAAYDVFVQRESPLPSLSSLWSRVGRD